MNEIVSEKILITGAGGMLGRYVADEFSGTSLYTLGLKEKSSFWVDLRESVPEFGDHRFDTVIHCAGTEDESEAMTLNLEGTRHLLKGLGANVPLRFVFISSYKVYSQDAGENINEEANTWASDEAGVSKIRTEKEIRDWASKNDVTLTIIRPARMFGNGVGGETLRLFNDALSNKYIHIRGNDARVSIVTAYDVARAIKRVYKKGGLYNAADGRNPKFVEMIEGMTANAGAKKRVVHLPAPWAEWVWRLGRWIPSVARNLAPDVVEKRMKTLTLDGRHLAENASIEYFDTIEVMEHKSKGYPYKDSPSGHSEIIA